jgi:hypothetical protein
MDKRVVAYRFGDYPSGFQQILEALKLASVVNEQVQRVRDACADSECRAPFGKVVSALYTLSGRVKENERNNSPGFLDDLFDLSSIPLSGLAVSECVDVLAKKKVPSLVANTKFTHGCPFSIFFPSLRSAAFLFLSASAAT